MRKPIIAGNWKMHGSQKANAELVSKFLSLNGQATSTSDIEICMCPPSVYLSAVHAALDSSVALGAQDVSTHASGAYTGQISANMLSELGCQWVIIGHSERREYCAEDAEAIQQKIQQAITAGLKPMLCVGESEAARKAGQTYDVVGAQLDDVLNAFSPEALQNLVIAYEPIWAIGTGLTATPEEAQAVHAFLREKVAKYDLGLAKKMRILYGGSVKPNNASDLFVMPDIDGALVGGASLDAESFYAICAAQGNAL